jgi:hypothetical protein
MTAMRQEINLTAEHPEAYAAGLEPTIAELGRGRYLTIGNATCCDGMHDDVRPALSVLMSLAGVLKTACLAAGYDFRIGPLEALFWSSESTLINRDPCAPQAKLLLRVPDFIDHERFREARKLLSDRGGRCVRECVALQDLGHGLCVKVLHIGSHGDKRASIGAMVQSATSQGYALTGPRHEIYLSDPVHTLPGELRTILHLPIHHPSEPYLAVLPDAWSPLSSSPGRSPSGKPSH